MIDEKRAFLARLFDIAVKTADPYQAMKPHFLKSKPKGRTLVVGFGKGSIEMAAAFERLWQEAGFGENTLDGFVVTKKGQETPLQYLDVMSASHPVPNENSVEAAVEMMHKVAGLGTDDLLIALISGGGSSLLVAPADGLNLDDKIALNQALLASGAPISVMNAIRKQASLIKGGRLAQLAHPAKVISYIISDVPGDDPALVSSGPTVADTTNPEETLALLRHYHIVLTPRLRDFFAHLGHNQNPHSLKSSTRDFKGDEIYLVASARRSLIAARDAAKCEGCDAILLSDSLEGEARDVAYVLGSLAREIKLHNQPFKKPVILLSGGETTVTLTRPAPSSSGKMPGSGGRNSEFVLALSQTIAGLGGITALSADTDGIDGTSQSAGAFCDGSTLSQLRLLGIDPLAALHNHNSADAFAQIDALFTTGPTGSNINDFRAILIE